MTTFLWIFFGGIAMSAIALVGSVTLVLREENLKKLLLPLVALAAGTLLGGASFHMIPAVGRQAWKPAVDLCLDFVWIRNLLRLRAISSLAPLSSSAERASAFDVLDLDRRRTS